MAYGPTKSQARPFNASGNPRPNACGDSAAVRELHALWALLEPLPATEDMQKVKAYVAKRLRAHRGE